jgi:hypothetical protein
MTEESFFVRWSRRKREMQAKARQPATPAAALPESSAKLPPSEGTGSPVVMGSLPPVEAIDGSTDIRGFLAEGVPAALSRAALRRAWASDPSIRDFVGLAENAWDFTTPEGVPGFGAISADEIRRLLAAADDTSAAQSTDEAAPVPAADPVPSQAAADLTAVEGDNSSVGAGETPDGKAELPPLRRHGGALPE